ncbi:MAG: class I SAM-dependent methyltransferase [Gammaproteobacteria bacterium]|nr:class I SAM-dependent methyltransferase [Gammaproteobacteria bacterium]
MLKEMDGPPLHFVLLWSGEEIPPLNIPPVARVTIRDRVTLLKLIINPDLHFGNAYGVGDIEVEGDLVQCLEAIYRGVARMSGNAYTKRLSRRLNKKRPNTAAQARDNIHHHYDIGNEFYKLWLDERMVYTCAYFSTPSVTLEEAQTAKMDHVCRKLWLKPGETVVEAGCGWGSLALHMARHYGVKVKAFNISHQQVLYARERAKAEGLDSKVEYVEDDYRNISGQFDALVSVGMLEHVGKEHYQELGDVIHRCLKPSGRGLIHSIGRSKACPMNAWVEKRIFPGAYPPTLREMMDVFEPWEFAVLDVENLRLHYAKTLEHWLARFERVSERVAEMYDRRFVREWRLYLAGSQAAFTVGDLQLFQVLFSGPANNAIPWTRAHLYQGQGE